MGIQVDSAAGHDVYDGLDLQKNVEAARRVLEISEHVPSLEIRVSVNDSWRYIRHYARQILADEEGAQTSPGDASPRPGDGD